MWNWSRDRFPPHMYLLSMEKKKHVPPMPDGAFLFHVNFTHLAWGDRFPPHLSYGFEFGGAVGYQIWLDLYHRIEQESFLLKDNVIESESNGNTYSCSIFKEISINRIIHNTFQMHLKMEQSKHHLPLTIKEKMWFGVCSVPLFFFVKEKNVSWWRFSFGGYVIWCLQCFIIFL